MKWQTIYKTSNPQRVEIVKAILIEKGFNPIIINKKDSSYLLGMLELQVNEEEVLRGIREVEKIKFE